MKTYFLANWKEHGSVALVRQMVDVLTAQVISLDKQVVIFPPEVYLSYAYYLSAGLKTFQLGAQDLSVHAGGAYTGEVSGGMLKEVGAQFVLVGHSERRQFFKEDDHIVAAKFNQALQANLIPVLCVGETEREYEAGHTEAVVQRQLEAVLKPPLTASFLIAYEPVWAIGTGRAATTEQAESVHRFIRALLKTLLGDAPAAQIPLLYGGSVNPKNMADFLKTPDVNGVLIGSASLDPAQFASMIGKTTKIDV